MEKAQVYSSLHLDLCKKLVKDVTFYLLTKPTNWRYTRDEDWSLGEANNFDDFVSVNSHYLYRELLNEENNENFNLMETEDNEDEYYEAELEIYDILRKMFPTIDCLHGNDQDYIKCKFIPELRKLYAIFHE
jgi:hypothetical protein